MPGTRVFAALFIALAACALWETRNLAYWAFDSPGPRLLPLWVSLAMIAAAVWLIVMPAAAGEEEGPQGGLGMALRYLGLLVVTVFLFARVGAAAAMALFIAAELVLIERYPFVRAAILGVVCSAAIYAVFVFLLHLRLPGFALA